LNDDHHDRVGLRGKTCRDTVVFLDGWELRKMCFSPFHVEFFIRELFGFETLCGEFPKSGDGLRVVNRSLHRMQDATF